MEHLTYYYSTTSDPSDSWSGHWSNAKQENEENILTRKQLNKKRKWRIYWRLMIG